MTTCKFNLAWAGSCGNLVEKNEDFCAKHLKETCCVCGEQATRQCDYTGQFICGYPLCDNCEGWEDLNKPSGAWGFLNHSHRRKEGKK